MPSSGLVAHRFCDQPANLRYRTIFFVAIGLVIRRALVLSKLNLKCDNRRVFMLDQQAPVPRLNKAIVLLMGLYTAHLCLHLCASALSSPCPYIHKAPARQ